MYTVVQGGRWSTESDNWKTEEHPEDAENQNVTELIEDSKNRTIQFENTIHGKSSFCKKLWKTYKLYGVDLL